MAKTPDNINGVTYEQEGPYMMGPGFPFPKPTLPTRSIKLPPNFFNTYRMCPKCKYPLNTGNYCQECGTELPEPKTWTCRECNFDDNTGKYCQNCGKRRKK